MRIKFVIILIIIQIVIIALLAYIIYKKRKNVLGVTSINPIKKESLIFPPDDALKYFYEPKPNIVEHTPEWLPFNAIYTINGDALNERLNYAPKKSESTFRIITLGDSFTFGVGVNTENNWPEKLEDLLNTKYSCKNINRFEIINLGVAGYDFEYAVERFRRRGTKYSPDLILWLMIEFDRINEKLLPLRDVFLSQMKNGGEFEKLVKEGKYYQDFKNAKQETIKQVGEKSIYEYQKKVIARMNSHYLGKLLLIIPPWFNEKEKTLLYDFSRLRNNIFLYNLPFSILDKKNKFPDDHPNEKGHQIISQEVFNYLTKTKIIPCD